MEFRRTWPVDATPSPVEASPFRAVNTGTPYYAWQESTVHHPSTLIDPRRLPNWKVDARPRLRSIYYSTSPSNRLRRCVCVARVRGCRGPPHSRSFRASKRGMKNCWKFWQRALAPPTTPLPSRLHLIKGAWSSSGLRKKIFSPHTYTHPCSALSQPAMWTNCITRGYRSVSVSPVLAHGHM